MAKYRIVKSYDGYYPQKKFLFFWMYLTELHCDFTGEYDRTIRFDTKQKAIEFIEKERQSTPEINDEVVYVTDN